MIKPTDNFILKREFLSELIKPITAQNKNMKIDISESKYSQSLYLYIKIENTITAIRISDHKNTSNNKYQKNEMIVNTKTKCWRITKLINNVINKAKFKRLYYLLETISEETKRK